IEMIKAGTIDAQENPFANTVTYGVHKFHRFHTISNHFYISRPVFLHRAAFDAWPADVQAAMCSAVTEAVAFQRGLAIEEDGEARRAIEAQGCEIVPLRGAGRAAAPRFRHRGAAAAGRGTEDLGAGDVGEGGKFVARMERSGMRDLSPGFRFAPSGLRSPIATTAPAPP